MAIAEYDAKVAGFEIKYHDLDDATAAQGQWDAEMEAAERAEGGRMTRT